MNQEPLIIIVGEQPACRCYKTNDFDSYAAVMTGGASEWTVTADCPLHRTKK